MRPEVQPVLVTCADDSVVVLTLITTEYLPSGKVRWQRLATAAQVEREIARMSTVLDAHRLPVKSWRFLDLSELPGREFRDAWHAPSGKLAVRMDRAREIHRTRLRAWRAPRLAALDTDYLRAHEVGDTDKLSAVAQQKQALRDLTANPEIDAALTPEVLSAIWPS